jgi:hypothetical protein
MKDCNCGCNEPVATKPIEMLRFLSARFKHGGVSEVVAESYARDIDAILTVIDAAIAGIDK